MKPEDIMVDNGNCKLGAFDLTCPRVFKKVAELIKRGLVKWLHLAPPCATFSRARKDGLRAPWGSRARSKLQAKMEQADELARNTFRLASLQIRAGGFVSVENPEHSLIWKIKAAQEFLNLQGVYDVCGDQCCGGGLYVKPTRWRSNCPWMKLLEERCPGEPSHQRHQTLKGWMDHGNNCTGWLTALGAEYPEGLCDKLAKGYAACTEDPVAVDAVTITDDGTHDPLLPESRRRLRQRENSEAIGGMRSPHQSIKHIPGWGPVGEKLQKLLDQVIDNHWEECCTMVDNLGKVQEGLPDSIVEEARREMELWLNVQHRESIPCKVRADLVEALTKEAGDPDDVIAEWLRGETPFGYPQPNPNKGDLSIGEGPHRRWGHHGGDSSNQRSSRVPREL